VEGRLLWIYGHASSTRRKREVGRPVTHLDSVGRHAMQDGGFCCSAHASMPLKFWDEAFLAATYIINRVPSKVINYTTPLERLFGQKPDYSFLRVFGCACWPNLRPYNKHKLQFRSKQCVFLGYSNIESPILVLVINDTKLLMLLYQG
jgi:hypothetical protein